MNLSFLHLLYSIFFESFPLLVPKMEKIMSQLITKIKKTEEYIPFGPFIVIATFISMYVPFEQIKNLLMTIFTLGMYRG